jgi:hypothetical protein
LTQITRIDLLIYADFFYERTRAGERTQVTLLVRRRLPRRRRGNPSTSPEVALAYFGVFYTSPILLGDHYNFLYYQKLYF